MSIFKKIFVKKNKCNHVWRISVFQRLTDDYTSTYKCEKCGKYKQMTREEQSK